MRQQKQAPVDAAQRLIAATFDRNDKLDALRKNGAGDDTADAEIEAIFRMIRQLGGIR